MTENDYELGLYNGDTGVVVRERRRASDAPRSSAAASCSRFSPPRLGAVETVYAMTIHKSQGSQFDTAAVLLPAVELADPDPRAALHGGHARAPGADRGRDRGGRAPGGRAPGGAGVGVARKAVDTRVGAVR